MNSSVLKGSAVLVAIGAAQDTETEKHSARKRVATLWRTERADQVLQNIPGLHERGGCMSITFDCTPVRGFHIIEGFSDLQI